MLSDPACAPPVQNACSLPARVRALVFLGSLLAPLALVSCAATAGNPAPQASPPPVVVSVSAPAASVATGDTAQFSVAVQNAQNPAVNWSTNFGSVTQQGLYTAPGKPPSPPTVIVTATLAADATKFGSATITTVAAGPPTFGVFSWRSDAMLSGVNDLETALTPATINNTPSRKFGKLFSCAVDGEVYAQPLYAANVSITAAGVHNVVFVATEHDSVYAFDADASPCRTLWHASFLDPTTMSVTTVPSCPLSGALPAICGPLPAWNGENDVDSDDIQPEIGITGTPVIDPVSETLYVVAKTKESTTGVPAYVQCLHALDITTGQEKSGSPAVIQPSVNGSGAGNDGQDHVPFDPLHENQRPALALFAGNVYIAFGSPGGTDPFHGWLLAYNATTLAQVAVVNTTPNGSGGGIGESGAAPSVDANGNIFVATGKGTFDASSATAPNTDYAQTLLRLPINLTPTSFNTFTPFDQRALTANQQDFGSSGVLLLPNQSTGPPHLAIVGGEAGILYLINRDNLGKFTPPPGPDNVLGKLNLSGAIYGTPVFWQGALYATATGQNLSTFSLSNGTLSTTPSGLPTQQVFQFPAPSPVISANGASNGINGIVWVVDSSGFGAGNAAATPAVLHAYDASNLGNEVYSSSANSADAAGLAVKFTVPTVMNGKVYVGTQGELSVYGLLP